MPEREIVTGQLSNQMVGWHLIEMQASYSTADIEAMVFYGESRLLESPIVPGQVQMAVVAGEYYVLEPAGAPEQAVPFAGDAQLLGWAQEAE